MIWVDRLVRQIKERKLPLEHVDDMKTPSGRIHVGALEGVIYHDLIYKVFIENEVKTDFTYVFNDMDPMDAIPSYLHYATWQKYEGEPLFKVPSPEKGVENFAQYFANEFKETFEKLNCHPDIILSSKLYTSGKMNSVIREALDQADKVREIYARISKSHRAPDWHPFEVICENCGKIGTTHVYQWDGKHVYYHCQPHKVAWAKGCNHKGKITPFDGHGKLHWKVDWAAHWKVLGVTVEGSGKDHMSKGGSYDVSSTISKEVFNYNEPYAFGYEWFTIGGHKMSSSKGVGVSAKEVSEILPPDVFRFLIVRSPIDTHIDFNPYGETIPRIFDDYDRHLNAYFDKLEKKLPKGKPGEVLTDFARIMELSQVRTLPDSRLFLPRFRTIVNLIKNSNDLLTFFEKLKGKKLTSDEKEILEERETYAQVYLQKYVIDKTQETHHHVHQTFQLSEVQIKFIKLLVQKLEKVENEKVPIQKAIFDSVKESKVPPKEAYISLYQTLLKKPFGPNATDLILELGIPQVIERLTIKNI